MSDTFLDAGDTKMNKNIHMFSESKEGGDRYTI